MNTYKYAIKINLKSNAYMILIFFIFNILLYFCQPLNLLLYKNIISCIEKKKINICILSILLILLIYALNIIISNVLQLIRNKMQCNISKKAYIKIFDYVKRSNIDILDNEDYYLEIDRAKKSICSSLLSVFTLTIEAIGRIISLVAVSTMIKNENYIFLMFFLLMGILQNVFTKKHTYEMLDLVRICEPFNRKAQYFGEVLKKRKYVKEIRLYELSDWIENKRKKSFESIVNENKSLSLKWMKINFSWAIFMYILEGAIYFLLFLFLGESKIDVAGAIFLIQSQSIFINSFSRCLQIIPDIKKNCFFIESLKNLDLVVKKENKLIGVSDKIILKNINFYYKNNHVLKNINLIINKGEKIAIIGENGSGKSTLVKLIAGLLQPQTGYINLYSDKISIVFQDYAHFLTSIRENVGFGNKDYIEKNEKLINELKRGGGEKLLEKVNYNIDIQIGKELYENGIDISGGEWQRIAIGRCLVAEADIIILDESVSALDPYAEKHQIELMNTILKNKTVLIITHRLSFLQEVDKVIFIKYGSIIDIGKHRNLLENSKVYRDLIESNV